MEIFYVLLLLLVCTRVFGEVAVRLKQPALVGQLLSGILLGVVGHYFASRAPFLADITEDKVFVAVTDLAVFFLMLMAGLEMHPRELLKGSGGAMFVAVAGMIVPLLLGLLLGWWVLPESEYRSAQMLYLGTSLAVTAVPVSVKILMELGKLHSRFGRLIVSSAILDDALGLLLLALLTAFVRSGQLPEVGGLLALLGQILLFFAVTTAIGMFVLPRLGLVLRRFAGEEVELSALLIVGLAFAVLAELLGMHFVVGAFAAGLFFSGRHFESRVYEDVQRKISGVTLGFLAPLFFASIGMHLDPIALTAAPLFLALLIATAVVGKLLGAGLPALLIGLPRWEAAAVGVGMSARATVELIIAKVALEAGLFSQPDPPPAIVKALFSAVVIMAVTTTVLVPIALKQLVKRTDADPD